MQRQWHTVLKKEIPVQIFGSALGISKMKKKKNFIADFAIIAEMGNDKESIVYSIVWGRTQSVRPSASQSLRQPVSQSVSHMQIIPTFTSDQWLRPQVYLEDFMETPFIEQGEKIVADKQQTGFLDCRDRFMNRLSPLDQRCTGGQLVTVI